MITFEELWKVLLDKRDNEEQLLDDVTVKLPDGEFIAIVDIDKLTNDKGNFVGYALVTETEPGQHMTYSNLLAILGSWLAEQRNGAVLVRHQDMLFTAFNMEAASDENDTPLDDNHLFLETR